MYKIFFPIIVIFTNVDKIWTLTLLKENRVGTYNFNKNLWVILYNIFKLLDPAKIYLLMKNQKKKKNGKFH